jgi:hypothetical protein
MSIGLAALANNQAQPATARGSATGSAQAATAWSKAERLPAG